MEARRVPRTDTDLTTVERGQNVKAGQSSCTFSPSTFVFHPNTDNQTNGTASKKASKQLESRRRRTRKHKRKWDFFLWLYLTKPKREIFWTTSFICISCPPDTWRHAVREILSWQACLYSKSWLICNLAEFELACIASGIVSAREIKFWHQSRQASGQAARRMGEGLSEIPPARKP